MKKKLVIITLAMMLAVNVTGCGEKKKYDAALELMAAGSYQEAITAFEEIPDYEDVPTQINECKYMIADAKRTAKDYDTAIADFEALGDYKDSAERISEAKYTKAGELFEKLDFEAALAIYNEISDYEDSAEMIEKCEYELSVDGQFMRALADGLMARWDYTDDPDTALVSDDIVRNKACDIEIEKLEQFEKEAFDNEELGIIAKDYISTVKAAKTSLKYFTVNSSKYYDDWETAYEHRVILLETFKDEYGLSVDEKYQDTFDGLMADVEASKERIEIEKQIKEIIKTIKFTSSTDEWGYVSYKVSMKNVSDYTFDYISITANAEDSDDTIIDTAYINTPNNWASGKKFTSDVYFGTDFNLDDVSFSYDISYSVNGFYGEM